MCDDACPLRPVSGPGAAYRVVGPSRRQFIAQSTLAAIAAALTAACGDGVIGGIGPDGEAPAPPTEIDGTVTIRVADYPALQSVGGIARISSPASNPLAVARTGTSTFVALSLICPHAGYKPLEIVSGGFRCPNHDARFAADGNWVGGQRTRDLQSYPTSYNAGAGTLTIG